MSRNCSEHHAETRDTKDVVAEMLPFMVDAPNVDDSPEAVYSQLQRE
jgi:hypothetical protein